MRKDWEDAFVEEVRELGSVPPAARVVGRGTNTVYYHLRKCETFRARVEQARRQAPRPLSRRFGPYLLALLLASPLAAIESDPFPLGSEGLSLTVTLLHWTEEDGEWGTASAVGIDVVDEGDGQYSLADLPAATGTDRYHVTVALASDPDRGLAAYSYGAIPGVRMVWREEIAPGGAPMVFRAGDTYGSISMTVLRRLPAEACAATATFSAGVATTGAALFSDRAATISNCELDATTGTYGATFTYDLQAGDTATVGKYVGEFEICYEPGSCQVLPATNTLRWEVVRRVGG